MQPFLAMIIPVGAPQGPGQPPGIWGGANQPFPGYGLPGNQPGIWPGPGPLPHPEHPIAPGGRPPGTWGGSGEPFPGTGLPGDQPRPGHGPGFPTPPIVIPPEQPGQPPLVIWGPGDPRPMPPINLPPGGGQPPPGGDRVPIVEWHTVWSEQTGWAVIGIAQGKQVTPSQQSGQTGQAQPKR